MRETAKLSISEIPPDPDESRNPGATPEEEIFARPTGPDSKRRPQRALPFSDPGEPDEESAFHLPFDPMRLFGALKRRWYLWAGAGVVLFALGLAYTFNVIRSTVGLQLIRRESPSLIRASDTGEAFRPQQFSGPTLVALIKNPEVLMRTAAGANPPIAPNRLALAITVTPQPETDLVTLVLKSDRPPQQTVDLLNLYASELVKFTQEMQTKEAASIVAYTDEKLKTVERELAEVDAEMRKLPPEAKISSNDKLTETYLIQLSELEVKYELARMDLEHNNPINDRLRAARSELAGMLIKWTEEHPSVKDQRLRIKTLEAELASAGTNLVRYGATTSGRSTEALLAQTATVEKQAEQLRVLRDQIRAKLEGLSDRSLDYALIKSRFQSLESLRSTLASRQREAQLSVENALGYFQVFTPATVDRVSTKGHLKKGVIISIVGAFLGMLGVAVLILLTEVFDDRIKTASDLTRVTGLPLLATLGDLDLMNAKERQAWAFRTWTILKGKLTEDQHHGMVCGFIAANHGEGCSTWINMLIKTANQRGLRVLTVATLPSEEPAIHPHEATPKGDNSLSTTLSPTAFAFPAQVSQQLNDPNSQSIVHIPLPGWVWNLERRQQWQTALDHWSQIDNLVLLVELPPASEPESVLLAEKLPQLVWLADSGKPKIYETRMYLETLRHAGCNLVGAVLNHEPASFWQRHFVRRFGMGALVFALSAAPVSAQEAVDDPSTNAALAFSVTSPKQKAAWQKRLTLGPGDILSLGFFGETNLTKPEVPIRSDGRISYLQAHDVIASGLTVDELRDRLNEALSKYYTSPRVLISPVAFNSKKYYVVGKVLSQGAFTLDRPITVVEAVARARGLETGVLNRNSVDLADFEKSFLIRDGKRLPIDFGKLFQQGDLSQNIAIEPNDFLYFPPAALKEVYVVGEVTRPGVVAHTADTSILTALAERGGFTKEAFKSRVLVVRGSLNNPQTFVANTSKMVDARAPDFKLQPKDIVYVSARPFIKAEELLDVAATSFIQSAVTAWTGGFVGPLLTRPFVPNP